MVENNGGPAGIHIVGTASLVAFFFFFWEIAEMKYTMVLAECQGYSPNECVFAFPKGMFVCSQ